MTNLKGIDKVATGKRIKNIMNLRGMDVNRVSSLMALTYQCVYRWTKGEVLPDIDNLFILSRILKVKVDDLLVGISDIDEKEAFKDRLLIYCTGLRRVRLSAIG